MLRAIGANGLRGRGYSFVRYCAIMDYYFGDYVRHKWGRTARAAWREELARMHPHRRTANGQAADAISRSRHHVNSASQPSNRNGHAAGHTRNIKHVLREVSGCCRSFKSPRPMIMVAPRLTLLPLPRRFPAWLKWYGSTFATLRPSGKLNMFLAGAEEYRTSSTNEPSCESHEETHELREHTYPVSLQTREQISFFQFEKPRTGAGSQDDCGIGQCIAQQTGCTSSTRRNGLLMKSSSPDKTNSRNDGIAESSTRQEQRTREQLDALADIIRMLRAHRSERLAHVEATQPAPSPTEPATTTDLNTDTVLP
jgi:hypothetical protein